MSKRSKDLFHLLEQREKEVRSDGEAPVARRQPARAPAPLVERVRHWLGTAPATGRGSRRNVAGTPPAAPYGLVLAAVALLCLGAGFMLGRFLPRGVASATLDARGDEPRRPGPVPQPSASETAQPDPGELPAERVEEILSNRFFWVLKPLTFSARQESARLAAHLRSSGVDTARIRPFNDGPSVVWMVCAYETEQVTAATLLAKLAAVPATPTWPSLASECAKLKAEHILYYKQPKR